MLRIISDSMPKITIYSSWLCPFCHRAKALLKEKGAKFNEITVDMDPGARTEMRNKAGGRNTVPQIFINGQHYGGCDDLFALDAAGKLDPILGKV